MEYVKRCKNKTDLDTHNKCHVAEGYQTRCGKKLDYMWMIVAPQEITCEKCKKAINQQKGD